MATTLIELLACKILHHPKNQFDMRGMPHASKRIPRYFWTSADMYFCSAAIGNGNYVGTPTTYAKFPCGFNIWNNNGYPY